MCFFFNELLSGGEKLIFGDRSFSILNAKRKDEEIGILVRKKDQMFHMYSK